MRDIIEPILPQVPVEGIALHIGRSRLSMGDAVVPRLMADGQVGLWARVVRPWMGIIPVWRDGFIGQLGPVASEILAPAIEAGQKMRLRVVMLTPEHLAGDGQPEIHVSIWGDPKLLVPFLDRALAQAEPTAVKKAKKTVSNPAVSGSEAFSDEAPRRL
ncbi:hypothetical protein Q9295_09135 [Xinfangfangia sp. CPCC 101601]|uniref:Uncharacterized protein n=1 Tax=Pseudogemmobacter lacusdianii TaxID=3069608 RepID=A0ABU0VXQ4_9RHOB|nr:hypothetical protein [Xinfangfangia sp. CPCC 101601]MDQ2066537.1 hypothetical protein [Xinfangfangia sp. CPCC 101601]